ncbi:RHTO0S02e15214g1_1 [Rhodotorula toruloides]|uniref:RHTO0S02e15214g1_1 n=1 Tax=Rhodotorula toruloides TaxID=5286 RepID=A0A061AK37_RHOTO|nr:RHTO0S02e15214g1_1 [Rhodotorula toruloides]
MAEAEAIGSFRLGRLRLIRLPPSSISLPASGSKKPHTAQIELAVGVTDDYGTDLMFDSVDLRMEVLDGGTLEPPAGVILRLANSSSASSAPNSAVFTFSPSNGPFHTLKLSLTFQPAFLTCPVLPSLSFRLSVDPRRPLPAKASEATRCVRTLVGEIDQAVVETWDDRRYVLMGVRSGDMGVKVEGREVKIASEKVQTALRTIYLPFSSRAPSDSPPSSSSGATSLPSASPSSPPISIVERPGLNNSTGQRLWDCAIGMSAFLSLFPHALDASAPLPPISAANYDEPSSKKRRVENCVGGRKRRIRVVELGAGCALVSMAASRILSSAPVAGEASVLATDVEATVETTLRENLEANSAGKAVEAAVLDWGELSQEAVDSVVGGRARRPRSDSHHDEETSLTLLATDVLYNPSSHDLLLSTLLSLLQPHSSPATLPASRRALIAYKRRTEGDDGFFSLAKDAGLEVTKVWEWGEVSVWSFV